MPCPRSNLSRDSSKLVYAVSERTQSSKNIVTVFLTPGLPSWIVCRGNWINGISQDMGKSGKSPVEVWSLRFVQ